MASWVNDQIEEPSLFSLFCADAPATPDDTDTDDDDAMSAAAPSPLPPRLTALYAKFLAASDYGPVSTTYPFGPVPY